MSDSINDIDGIYVGRSFLIFSGHDYRSPRKANMHFIADELKKLSQGGNVRFASVGFSPLSRLKRDPRVSLWSKANKVETANGIECYLWRTPLHPFNLQSSALRGIERVVYKAYPRWAPPVLKQWMAEADFIVVESGIGLVFLDMIKSLAPEARLIYIASDLLETIGCAGYLCEVLRSEARSFDLIRVPSEVMLPSFPNHSACGVVPHGIDRSIRDIECRSPYRGGVNIVSVGSMLFDPSFFEIAAPRFPDVTFHIIGGGKKSFELNIPNVKVYPEMPFRETIAYIKHAQAGVAPYNGNDIAPYLADTSMKLMQYGFLGVPAICPSQAVGNHSGRFGYEPGNAASIEHAVREAITSPRFVPHEYPTWTEVAERILDHIRPKRSALARP